jgi:hypothetical protein
MKKELTIYYMLGLNFIKDRVKVKINKDGEIKYRKILFESNMLDIVLPHYYVKDSDEKYILFTECDEDEYFEFYKQKVLDRIAVEKNTLNYIEKQIRDYGEKMLV